MGLRIPIHELLLLWIVSPAGSKRFYPDTCNPPGVPPKQLTREQITEIARKYRSRIRITTCALTRRAAAWGDWEEGRSVVSGSES